MSARLIGALVAIALVVGLLLWGPAAFRSMKSAKKQAEVSQGQAGASTDSGAEAMNTVSNVAAADAETDALVASGRAEIAAAAQRQKGAAAKRAACRLAAYRDTTQCKEPVR